MNCERYLDLFDELLDGELDETAAVAANAHLFACPDCSDEIEILRSEREMYSHFLFEVEPPAEIAARFDARLARETASRPAFSFPSGFFAKFISAFRFSPAMVLSAAVLMLVAGFVWINVSRDQAVSTTVSIPNHGSTEIKTYREPDVLPVAKPIKVTAKPVPATVAKPESEEKLVVGNALLVKATSAKKLNTQTVRGGLTAADRLRIEQMRSVEIETGRQIEKVEMLLRSFRNASYTDNGKEFDLAYETEQARRLLDRNFELRQKAAGHGSAYAGEMLSRVEPYLLEIAHLDKNPSSTAVAEIRDRVKNQKIIASLQGF